MSSANTSLKHWQLVTSEDNQLGQLIFDKQDTNTNVLSREVLEELNQVLAHLENNLPAGLVIKSAKPNGFCAGADVEEFTKIQNYEQAYDHIRFAQTVFDRLESLNCPTLCVIHGFCLGGGFELALACHYRIAEDNTKTRIGLPEVKLGIHPGYGGSVRLTQLIGPLAAMPLILTGRMLNGRQADKLGIVSHAVPSRLLETAAQQFLRKPPVKHRVSLLTRLSNATLLRPFIGRVMRNNVAKKAKQAHYPAPYAQIDVWQRYGNKPAAMMKAEADSVAKLVTTSTAQNLIRLFFLQNQLKASAKSGKDKKPITHVHVVGAGVMGGDIAAWCALRGLKVTLQDRDASSIGPAIKRADSLFRKKLKIRREIQHAHDRLIPDVAGYGVKGADVIVEAIFEDLEAKQTLFKSIESRARPDAVLATNTSSIQIEQIAKALSEPARLVGIHFFNPVAQMQLVEIIAGNNSDQQALQQASIFTHQIGKLPLAVKSSPGFLVNRVLMPYLLEAVRAYESGIHGPIIDQAARNFGMPMGPIELADTVGLDICLHVADILGEQLRQSDAIPSLLRTMVDEGRLGRKSGEGFYRYHKGKHVVENVRSSAIPEDLQDRLILSLVNEARKCLDEGIIADSDAIDAGVVFGTGFAPFLGGPMNYAEQVGNKQLKSQLKVLENTYGDRFKAAAGWSD